MQRKTVMISALAGILAVSVSGCAVGSTAATSGTATARGQGSTAVAGGGTGQAQVTPTPLPTTAPLTTTTELSSGVSGIGQVLPEHDSDLVFQVQGTVEQVNVKEGDTVKQGDVLATLDNRTFDNLVKQAQASLQSARAAAAGLNDPPTAAEIAAANASIAQASASLQKSLQGANTKQADIQNAQAAFTAAQVNLQSTRDRLSQAKTQAESALEQASTALTSSQAAYATAKSNWEYVQETGNNPTTPNTTDASGKKKGNSVTDTQREQYYTTFVQADAALKQAEESVRIAGVNAEQARQAEITGIDAAQQTTEQARIAVERNQLPTDPNDINVARAAVAAAQANRNKLNPAPTNSQRAQAAASIAQAQASLETAQINRERTQIVAPFNGVISSVNIDPGDPSSPSGSSTTGVIRVLDTSALHIDVQISDLDIAKVSVGQQANIHVDALPDQTFTGKVSYIASEATVSGNVRTYVVRVVPDKLDGLRTGLSVRVDFSAPNDN